jgi:hypothetical protein
MSAVATKPRAKPAKRGPKLVVATPAKQTTYRPSEDGVDLVKRLGTLQAALFEVDEKLEMAYDAADNAEPIEEVLHHIAHDVLPDATRPMRGEQPTRADAEAVFDAMHVPLALLQAAISLATGTVLHQTLVEAFDLLDWAHDELDCCGAFVKLLPEQTAKIVQASYPAWEAASSNVKGQIGNVCLLLRTAADAAQRCETDAEKAVLDLGEMVVRMLAPVVDLLHAGPIDSDKAEAMHELLSDPVQILEALVGITAGTRFENSIAEVNGLILDASGAVMDMEPWDQAPQQSPAAKGDDQEERRRLAHDANHQIGELADRVKVLFDATEESPAVNGLMSRISVLAEVVHFAARLHGSPDDSEFPTMDKLQRAFKGQLSW